MMVNKKQILTAAVLAALLIAADQLSKIWAVSALEDTTIRLLGDILSLRLVFNPGAAFSLGAQTTWIFTLIAAAACIAIPIVAWRMERYGARLALTAVWAGAVGNLIDRLVREPGFGSGHVVDFIDYAGFFVGNIADIELVIGAAAFLVIEIIVDRSAKVAPHE